MDNLDETQSIHVWFAGGGGGSHISGALQFWTFRPWRCLCVCVTPHATLACVCMFFFGGGLPITKKVGHTTLTNGDSNPGLLKKVPWLLLINCCALHLNFRDHLHDTSLHYPLLTLEESPHNAGR